MRGETSIRIAERTPEQVFAVVADMERAPEWVPDLISVTKLTPGEVRVGTQYSEKVRMGKKEGDGHMTVTEYDPPHVFAHEGQGGPARFSARFVLEPDGNGTRFTHHYTVEMSGVLRLMMPLISGWMRKNSDASMLRLRELFERGE